MRFWNAPQVSHKKISQQRFMEAILSNDDCLVECCSKANGTVKFAKPQQG